MRRIWRYRRGRRHAGTGAVLVIIGIIVMVCALPWWFWALLLGIGLIAVGIILLFC